MNKPPSSPLRKPSWSCRVSAGAASPPSLASNIENLSLDDAIGKRLEGRKIKLLSIAIQLYALSADAGFLPLNTPLDDQVAVVSYARDHGCAERNIRVMREDSEDEAMRPTRNNILREIASFVTGSGPNDLLIFHYSGHGHQVPTTSDTEPDGLDEAIVTMDEPHLERRPHLIIDNILREKLVDPLQADTCLIAILDACKSGTLLDLDSTRKRGKGAAVFSPVFGLRGNSFKPSTNDSHISKRLRTDGGSIPQFITEEAQGEDGGVMSAPVCPIKRCASPERYDDGHPHIICFSACRDDQSAWSKGEKTFTHYVIKLLRKYAFSSVSPQSLAEEVNEKLRRQRTKGLEENGPLVISRLSAMQVAQVSTLAGQEKLLDEKVSFPRPIASLPKRKTPSRRGTSSNAPTSTSMDTLAYTDMRFAR